MINHPWWQHFKTKAATMPYPQGCVLLMALLLCGCVPLKPLQPPAALPQPTKSPIHSPTIHVAGTYATAVTLAESSCGAVTVAAMPTEVEQQPGKADFVLTHAGNQFNGTLQLDAAFTTDPLILHSGRDSYTVTVQGTFTPTGFDAQTTVAVQQVQAPQNCEYRVHWAGTKQGAPNVLP